MADASRVGVPADQVPPPPPIGRLPRLTKNERLVEARFADAFQSDPQKMIDAYAEGRNKQVGVDRDGNPKYAIGDAPNVFSTDDAKMLSDVYNPPADSGISPEDRLALRSRYNTVLHQTANAIAKKTFLQYLDQLPEGNKTVLVTQGGVAAGKDYALSRVEAVNNVANLAGAVWNSAGEQNSTENTWILDECLKRGIKPTFLYVHSNPNETWENPKRGVVERATKTGRMVDARLFADSYAIGAKNFAAFHKANQHNPNAQFFVLDNTGEKPVQVQEVPQAALQIDGEALYHRCVGFLQNAEGVNPAVKRGGTNGLRIWPEKKEAGKGQNAGIGFGVTERMKIDVQDPYGDDAVDVRVTKNPTPATIESRLRSLRPSNPLKGLIVGDDLYVWDDIDVHHEPMAAAIGVKGPVATADKVLMYWDRELEKVVIDKSRSGKNKAIQDWVKKNNYILESRENQTLLEEKGTDLFTGEIVDKLGRHVHSSTARG